jgi:hypothetical protein
VCSPAIALGPINPEAYLTLERSLRENKGEGAAHEWRS